RSDASEPRTVYPVAAGQRPPTFTQGNPDERTGQHAREFAGCTRAETIELHQRGAAVAASAVRRLSDAELARTGTVFAGMPPVSVEELVTRILLAHIDSHFGSIRRTIDHC